MIIEKVDMCQNMITQTPEVTVRLSFDIRDSDLLCEIDYFDNPETYVRLGKEFGEKLKEFVKERRNICTS